MKMRQWGFFGMTAVMIFGLSVHSIILGCKCDKLQNELIRQDMILLKQAEILAVNTAILKGVFAAEKTRNSEPEKEVFKIDHMP